MRTDLDHLPLRKRRELEWVVQVLLQEFDAARTRAIPGWKRRGRVLKIILYGSHARGTWVDEPHTAKGYRSDYDLLIIVNDRRLAGEVDMWEVASDRLARDYLFTKSLKTPVSFIVHSLGEVNRNLAEGRYFFMDIARDGVLLHESDKRRLRRPQPRTPGQALDMAREYFEDWYPAAIGRLDTAKYVQSQDRLKEAAFDMHQSVEFLYHCTLLALSFYTPNVHNIEHLRKQAERLDPRLFEAWPRATRKQDKLFQKLKDAYVKARYSKHYRIGEQELAWLGERVEALAGIVHTVCTDRLAELEAAVASGRTECRG